ncbi:MAG: serpin family protein [Gemmatimonadetes bacterium]|nr:serpin family protein [Gemmatimonadota bacterium]
MTRAAVAATLLLIACEGGGTGPDDLEPVRAFTQQELQLSSANTSFGLELIKHVHASASEPNVLISPLSASMALGMTMNGARDQTWDAMRSTLGFGGLTEAEINDGYRGLIAQLRARDPKIEFALANSVWHENTFAVEQPFLEALRTHFDAEARGLDFDDPASPGIISRWAEDRTGGRIKDLIKSIHPLEVMFLVNAVYFKAPWSSPFEKNATAPSPFRRLDGATVQVPTMVADQNRPFFRAADVEGVELLYADSAFSMVILLPAEGRSLDDLIGSITPERWQAWMDKLAPGRLMLRMPKFRFDFEKKLDDALKAMGMGIAFQAFVADFGRITSTRDDLYISRVQHKTFIDVHELGTEAAAATAVGIGVTSLPPSLNVDRPFLFAIRERSAGTILFIGRVGAP